MPTGGSSATSAHRSRFESTKTAKLPRTLRSAGATARLEVAVFGDPLERVLLLSATVAGIVTLGVGVESFGEVHITLGNTTTRTKRRLIS